MPRNNSTSTLANLLESYSPDVRRLALSTRDFVLDAVPNAMEMVDAKSKVVGYGYGTGYKDMFCSMMPTKIGVTFGIAWATELPDPHHLLEGSGKVHRHVKLKSESDLRAPALKALVKAASEAAMARRVAKK